MTPEDQDLIRARQNARARVLAVLLFAFVVAVFWHAQLGLQVVIEDYVHARGTLFVLQLAVKFLCFLGGAACALAILKIALGR